VTREVVQLGRKICTWCNDKTWY